MVLSKKATWTSRLSWSAPSNSPFYAVETKPMIYLTHGGVKVTANLEVVHVSGKIIPGLYALGEVVGMGQLAGNVLAGGMGNTPPITLGLLLGERLARTN